MKEERRALKEWLVETLPSELSRQDVADELGVTRKTVSSMLNPDAQGFGNGFTMLRYLRLVGALREPPAHDPSHSRLAALEEKADEALTGIADILDLLRQAPGESDEGAAEASPQ